MSKKNKAKKQASPSSPSTQRAPAGLSASPVVAKNRAPEAEPVADRRPVPIFLIVLLIVLIYGGDMYVMEHGADVMGKAGPFPSQVFDPFRTYQEVVERNPESPEDKILKLGKARFEMTCAPCHQSSGAGNPGTGIPPLVGSEWVKTPGPGRALRIVLNSIRGPIQVTGKSFDNPSMPPWRSLPDEDIAAILSYVRANKEWGNNAPFVKQETVKQVKDSTADRTEQWTADELMKIPETE